MKKTMSSTNCCLSFLFLLVLRLAVSLASKKPQYYHAFTTNITRLDLTIESHVFGACGGFNVRVTLCHHHHMKFVTSNVIETDCCTTELHPKFTAGAHIVYDGAKLGGCRPGQFSLFGDRAPVVMVRSNSKDKFCPGKIRLRTSLGVVWGANLDHRYRKASYYLVPIITKCPRFDGCPLDKVRALETNRVENRKCFVNCNYVLSQMSTPGTGYSCLPHPEPIPQHDLCCSVEVRGNQLPRCSQDQTDSGKRVEMGRGVVSH